MIRTVQRPTVEHSFRHATAWSVGRSVPAVAALAVALGLSLVLASPWPAALALVPLWLLVRQLVRHASEQVSLRGFSLMLCRGAFTLVTAVVPIWHVSVSTRQTLLGRLCNYGSISVFIDGAWTQIDGVGDFRRLRALIIQRQSELG